MQTRDQYDNDSVRAIFEAIAQDTINNAGGTYQHKTGATVNHTDGYYVGVGNVATVDIDAITYPVRVAVVAGILADVWPRTLPARAQYVGTWVERGASWTQSDTLYVDYSVHIPGTQNLDVALACARRHGELAVWDCKNGVSIDVPIITNDDARECFADIDPNLAALEVRDLIEELHSAIFGDDCTASIIDEDGNVVADTWIVERLRVLTDSEYAECAYGADDNDE